MKNANMEKFSISVVILATDERDSLIKTVDYINSQCSKKIDKTIIVLSRNAMFDCVKASEYLKDKYGSCVEITIQKEDGLGCATMHAVEIVKTSHMVYFPADLAIELESLDRMIDVAEKNKDIVVKSSRWLEKKSFIAYNKSRLILNKIAQQFLKVMFLTNLTDLTNPVQVIPSEYEKSIKWKEKGFCSLIEHTIVPVRMGYKCIEIPAKCFPRMEGESKNSWLKTARYLKTAIRVRFTPKRYLLKNNYRSRKNLI